MFMHEIRYLLNISGNTLKVPFVFSTSKQALHTNNYRFKFAVQNI